MKPARWRPAARDDRREAVRYYRDNASMDVARRLVDAIRKDLESLLANPGIASPRFGIELGLEGLKSWAISGLPVVLFYFEREDHLDVARLLGERQDIATILTSDPARSL